MNLERPSSPEASSKKSSSQRKPSFLDRVFRHLPAGSRNVAGAMALGAMEMMSDGSNKTFEQADALSQANDLVQEEKKEQTRRHMEEQEIAMQTEKLDELRKKIQNG